LTFSLLPPAGKDLVMLITIVAGGAGSAAIQAGRALLQKYEEQVRTALVTTACEVLVSGCGVLVLSSAYALVESQQ
jgi:hypothetical protein